MSPEQGNMNEDTSGDESGDQESIDRSGSPPEQLARSPSELLQSYPLIYIQNYVGGNVIGGTVGPKSRVRAGKIKVTTQSGNESTSSTPSKDPDFKDTASFEDWFFETNLDNQIHVLLVAVFAGNSLRFVNGARELLKNSLVLENSETKETDSPDIPEPYRRTISNILEKTQTTTSRATYTVESGPTEVTTVEFVDSDVQKLALEFLRSSIDIGPVRSRLVDWLIQVCTMHQIDLRSMGATMIDLTRSQAAIGLGELAKDDYGHYLSFIIRPWARSRDSFLRFVVGWILFALATEDNDRSPVFSLLTHWAKSGNDYLRWTAAAACSRVGLIDIDETLKVIKTLLESDSPHILHAVRVSIGLLYLSAKNAYKIIEGFATWLQSSQDNGVRIELIDNIPPMFLSFIQGKFADDVDLADEDEPTDNSSIPRIEVWHLIGREMNQGDYTLSSSVTALIKQGFIHKSARVVDWTCEVIEQWITEADRQKGDQTFVNSVCRVLVPLREDKTASRYIKRIVAGKKFINNPVAMRIKKAYESGG
jgi:hypothetical protein